MYKTTISLAVVTALVLFAASYAHARGFGGAHGGGYSGEGYHSGGYHGSSSYSGGGYHGSSYSGSRSSSGESGRGYGSASGSYNRSYEGSHGGSADASGERGAGYGTNGAAAGSTRDVSATGPKGQTYNSQQERGAAAGPNGAVAGGTRSRSATGADGQTYSGQRQGAAGYSAAHTALPTDAGYGMTASGGDTAGYVGHHQTEAVSGSVYAARGASVRTNYSGAGMFGQGWYTAHPGAWNPTGWTAGRAWGVATWPAVGSWYGWGSDVLPNYYDYGNNIKYQGDQVCFDNQPIATADQYYQQASTLAQSQPAPDPNSGAWMPLGVFGLVKGAESDPHYVMQLAVDKSGAVAGNYYDVISGTSVPVQGAVDKQNQRLAWTVGNNKTTVGETGIYNLTKDESPALIHIGKDKTQQWTLVRLKQPE